MTLYKYSYKGKYKNIIQDWGDTEYCEDLEEKIDTWLQQFNNEDKLIAIRLLEKFTMYRQKLLAEKIKDLYNAFIKEFEWANEIKTFFMLVNLKNKLSNSTAFACEFQKTIEINIGYDILEVEDKAIPLFEQKLVFIDDFAGTGSTFIKTIDLLIDKNNVFKEFEIVFLVVNISETALLNIQTYKEKNNLNIYIIKTDVSQKAFKENYIFNSKEFRQFRSKYYDICKSLSVSIYPFGYLNSESLIAFDVCVPNNNLSLFRDRSDKYSPLFYRRRPQEDDFCKHNQKKIKNYSHKNQFKSTEPIFDFKLMLFIIYCVKFGQRLNISKTCKTFGMTATQYKKKIDFCLSNALIKIDNERYTLGNNFDKIFGNNKNIKKLKSIDTEEDFCDIIRYTPVDFEKRFQGYD